MKTLQELVRSPIRSRAPRGALLCLAENKRPVQQQQVSAELGANATRRTTTLLVSGRLAPLSSLSVGQCSRNGQMLSCRASYRLASSYRAAFLKKRFYHSLSKRRELHLRDTNKLKPDSSGEKSKRENYKRYRTNYQPKQKNNGKTSSLKLQVGRFLNIIPIITPSSETSKMPPRKALVLRTSRG
jgi:hypothetical protein